MSFDNESTIDELHEEISDLKDKIDRLEKDIERINEDRPIKIISDLKVPNLVFIKPVFRME